jgi:uncharacterized SAM-binding protein YcdF (DUF218 family)
MRLLYKVFLVILAIVGAIFLISYPIIVSNLVVDERPVPADVIIVPEGEANRAEKAAELYFEGYSESNKIIVSPLTEENVQHYEEQNIPREALISETDATSTYTNAVNSLALMDEHNYQSAIIVTTDYHTLRTKLTYERVNEDYDFDLTMVAAYEVVDGEEQAWDEYYPEPWRLATREFLKIWGYWLGLYNFIDLE